MIEKYKLLVITPLLLIAPLAIAADYECPPPGNQSEADCSLFPKKDTTFVVRVTADAKANGHGGAWMSLDMKNGDKACNGKAGRKFPFSGGGSVSDLCVVKVKANQVIRIDAGSANENADATAIKIAVEQR